MKKVILILLLGFSLNMFSQEEERVKHHEIKLNAFNLIVFKTIEGSYEYLLNSESSIGLSVLSNLQDSKTDFFKDGPAYEEQLAITPYFRYFFSGRYASGFFMEAFGMYNIQEDYDEVYDDVGDFLYGERNKSYNMAFGMAMGGKFASRKGFVFEFYGGAGRNLSVSNEDVGTDIVPRLGISLGYRF